MMFKLLRRGRLGLVPTVETAQSFLRSEGADDSPRRMTAGTPEEVRARLEEKVRSYVADELMIVAITHSHEARMRSYELIADAFGLEEAGVGALAAAPGDVPSP